MPKIILVGGFLKSQTHALNNLAYMDRQSSLFDENGQEITVREAQQAVQGYGKHNMAALCQFPKRRRGTPVG